MDERRRARPTEQPAESDLGGGGVEQVPTADDDADVLAQVVDDDAEPVRPVPVAIADG